MATDITVVTYRMKNGRTAMTTATPKQVTALRAAGRLVKNHGHGGLTSFHPTGRRVAHSTTT